MAVYNRIYTNKKWEQVNKYNKDLMEDFLLELTSQKKSEKTIAQYRNDLRIMFIYILEELDNKPIYKLKKKHFRNYMLWLQEKEMSNARINRLMSSLRSCLTYASDEEDYEDEIEINYASKVKGLTKEKVRDIEFLSDEEIEYIYNRLVEKHKYQQALFLSLMYDSAGRRNECYCVDKDFVEKDPNFTNTVIGKRGKKFRLLYRARTKEAYELYMATRNDSCDSLWVTRRGGEITPASYETLYAWVISWRKILREKYENKEFNPHSFRHSALQNYEDGSHYVCREYLKGKPLSIEQLKLLAHHESVETTMSYLKDKGEDELLSAFGI
ncbi:tyrosine recombinase XerC [Paraclostridium bifermentans]